MTLLASAGLIGLGRQWCIFGVTYFAVLGVFFSIPAGIANDRFGAFKTALVGSLMVATGFVSLPCTMKESYH